MGKKFSLSIGFVFALMGALFLGFAQYSEASVLPTGGTIQNETPAFTAGPSDGSSSATTPTLVGDNVTFTATATDANGEQYYLAICKTNSATAGDNAAPTCPGGSWVISTATNSASQASVAYTALLADATTNAWYAFVCDKVVGGGVCSASSQGSGDSGAPFVVNHVPTQAAPSTRAHAFLDANSVGYWQFEDGTGATAFDDQTSNGNNASCVGSTCPTWTQEGAVGSGYQFDGTEDFITGSSLTPQLTGDVTLATWFKMSTLPSLQTRIIDLQQAAAAGLQLCISPTGVVLIDNSGGPSAGIATSGSFVDGVWHHAVTTREGTTYKLYVDGVYINSSGGTAPTYTKIQMAKESGVYFNGFIDEPHVYSRALSATEILNLYNSTTYAYDTHDLGVGARTLADADSNALACSVDWRQNGTSAAVLNMSFNKNVTATTTGAVLDYSSYANNGQLGGGTAGYVPTWTSAATCGNNSGGCYSFDGSDDFIQIPDSASLDITDKITLAGWVNVAVSGAPAVNQYVIDKQNLYSLLVEDDETISFYATNGGGFTTTTQTISLGSWHYLVATYDKDAGMNNVKIYIDGVLSVQATRAGALGTDTNPLRIGCYSNAGSSCGPSWIFNGKIDEPQVYSLILSSAQISAMYNAAKPNYQNFVSNETAIGDLWSSSLTCADTYGVESSTSASNSVEILGFSADVSDGGSSTTSPTNAGSNVTFTGTFNAPSARQWYLAVCKTNAVTAGNDAAPTCDGGSWAISAATVDGAQATTTYTALITDAESNAWYAFACDKVASVATCSPMTQGSGDSGSPFAVNHRPVIGTVKIGATCDTTTSVDPGNSASAKVTTDYGTTDDFAQSVVIQPDGKAVVGGFFNYDFGLARYSADGTLDSTFGTGGKVKTARSGDDRIYSVALQSDGKIVGAGWATNATLDAVLDRYNADGALDSTFGTGGRVTTTFGAGTDATYSVAIQSDGKIVAAGAGHNGTNLDFALVRYNADGSLDTAFDADGKVTTDFGSGDDSASSVAIQSDGKIVAAGYSYNGTNNDFALARYNADGSLDTSFDTDGKVVTAFTGADDRAYSVAIQTDGKIVVGGFATVSYKNFALARYNTNGSLDTSFDTDGMVTTAIGSFDNRVFSIALQSDAKIVAAGSSHSGSDLDFALARYTVAGALDTAFDTDGKVTTNISVTDEASSVAIQPNGKIVAVGYKNAGSVYDFALVRYTSAGALDDLSGYACAQVAVTDSDTSGTADTVDMHVCSTNSFTGSACAGTTYCTISDVLTGGSAQCVMDGRVPIPTAHGTVNAYVFLADSHGLVDAGTANTQSYSVTDTAPYIVDSSAYSVSAIALVAGNSTAKSYTVTVKDDNGDTDLVDTTPGYLFDDTAIDLVTGACTPSEANCYADSVCALSANTSGTDNQATATCDFTIWFNANYSSGWKLHVNPVDGQGAVTTQADSATVATNSLQGINITQTEIAYGGLALGATSSGILTTLQNMGNQVIDTLIQGTAMAGTPSGSIVASQQKWHNMIQDFAYASVGNVLVTDAAGATTKALGCADRNIAVRSDHATGTNSDESMYWKLQIPSSKPAGTYAGTNTFVASASTQCSDGE